MRNLIFILLITILVILVGTWPLTVLAFIFNFIGGCFHTVAKVLNFFGWNGMI